MTPHDADSFEGIDKFAEAIHTIYDEMVLELSVPGRLIEARVLEEEDLGPVLDGSE